MGTKILIIEDNEQNLYLITYILENAGHQVVQAKDGPAGIDRAQCERPDLVLLDIQLPGMDGYAVARELRSRPGLADLPIVAVTSHAMVGDREEILAAGCTAYLEKPIDPATFLGDVERHLPTRGRREGDLE